MHATVDNSVSLVMVPGNLQFGDNFIASGNNKMNTHGPGPAANGSIERGGKFPSGEAVSPGRLVMNKDLKSCRDKGAATANDISYRISAALRSGQQSLSMLA